jgi:glutathione S-transferase
MKIVEQARAPNPRRVRIFLAEKGIAVPYEQVDIMKREHRQPPFTNLNPFQGVPVLVLDDGTAISESVAICRYFEDLNPVPALFGRTPKERAVIEMWNRRVELGLYFRVSQAFRHTHPAMAELEQPQVLNWGELNRSKAVEDLRLIDAALADRPFIAGDSYSIADITALVSIDFMKPAKISMPAGLANLERWYQAVAARPSAKG